MAERNPYQTNIRLAIDNTQKAPLKRGGDDGTFDGMEARVAKLEAISEHMQRDLTDIKADMRTLRDNARTDFRVLFGALIFVALGLAGLMARGFHWV